MPEDDIDLGCYVTTVMAYAHTQPAEVAKHELDGEVYGTLPVPEPSSRPRSPSKGCPYHISQAT